MLRESAVNAVVAAVASGQHPNGTSAEDEEAAAEDLAVRVAVRARPLVAKERLERARECLSYPVDGKSVILGKNRAFSFDEVFDPTVEQGTIYADLVVGGVHPSGATHLSPHVLYTNRDDETMPTE